MMTAAARYVTPGTAMSSSSISTGARLLLMMASSLASTAGSLTIQAQMAITAMVAATKISRATQTVLICHEACASLKGFSCLRKVPLAT